MVEAQAVDLDRSAGGAAQEQPSTDGAEQGTNQALVASTEV